LQIERHQEKAHEKRDNCKKEEVMINDHSSSLSVDILSGKRIALCQGLHLAHASALALTQAATKLATQIIMSPMVNTSKAVPSSLSTCTWRMRTMDEFTSRKKQ
jgi:hypothetical protein